LSCFLYLFEIVLQLLYTELFEFCFSAAYAVREVISMKTIFLGWTAQPFHSYIDALTALGAAVEREDPSRCDALLLPGGSDVHPRRYAQPVDGSTEIDEARDDCEFALFRLFYDTKRPILGICRGMQLLNVALGGTLHQHIENHSQIDGEDRRHFALSDDPRLVSLYGGRFPVNSAHHQAVDRPGDGLRVIARAEDGVTEAVRHESLPILGLQWHPERLRAPAGDGLPVLEDFLKSI